MDVRKTLANNIKILMKQARLQSQVQLAQITGVSQSQISYILRCDKSVSTKVLEQLAQGLECEPWLMLAPTSFLETLHNREFAPLMHRYMRLDPSAQDMVWKIIHELYEAIGKSNAIRD